MTNDRKLTDSPIFLDLAPTGESAPRQAEDSFAQRARNHTVMLSPEITQQVRARLHSGHSDESRKNDDLKKTVHLSPSSLAALGVRPSEPESTSQGYNGHLEVPDVTTNRTSYPPASNHLVDSNPQNSQNGSTSLISSTEDNNDQQYENVFSSLEETSDTQNREITSKAKASSEKSDGDFILWIRESPIIGFLISYDQVQNGEVFELRSGRLVITSDKNFPSGSSNLLVVKDSKVSWNHAVLRISTSGDIQLLDQLSEYGTQVVRCDESQPIVLNGDKCILRHGDILKLGERLFHVCVVQFHHS